MFETIKAGLTTWAQKTTDRQKLQHLYAVLLGVVIFIAGLVALFNGTRSRQLMYIALAILTTFVVNYLAWSLLQTTLLQKLPKSTTRSRR